jgi:hypothetical protein
MSTQFKVRHITEDKELGSFPADKSYIVFPLSGGSVRVPGSPGAAPGRGGVMCVWWDRNNKLTVEIDGSNTDQEYQMVLTPQGASSYGRSAVDITAKKVKP